MKIITHQMIKDLKLNPMCWFEWADTVLKNKHLYIMPAKTSIHFGTSYLNTMPSILPPERVGGGESCQSVFGQNAFA